MDGNQYREALLVLGLTQTGFGTWLGVHPVTAKTWAKRGPPPAVAKWVEFLLANQRQAIPQAVLEHWKEATEESDWHKQLSPAKVRQLISELERLRNAMGGDPAAATFFGPMRRLGQGLRAPQAA